MVHEPIYEIKRNSGTVIVFFYFDCTWYQYPFPMLELNQIDPTTPFSLSLPMSAGDWCPDLTFENTAPWSFPFPLQITAFYFNSRFPLNFPSPLPRVKPNQTTKSCLGRSYVRFGERCVVRTLLRVVTYISIKWQMFWTLKTPRNSKSTMKEMVRTRNFRISSNRRCVIDVQYSYSIIRLRVFSLHST